MSIDFLGNEEKKPKKISFENEEIRYTAPSQAHIPPRKPIPIRSDSNGVEHPGVSKTFGRAVPLWAKEQKKISPPPSRPAEFSPAPKLNQITQNATKKNTAQNTSEKSASFDINLATDEVVQNPRTTAERQAFVVFLSIFVSLFLLALGYAVITYQGSLVFHELESLDKESKNLDLELSVYQERLKEVMVLQKQLIGLSDILKTHPYWTNLFAFLEANTSLDVRYTDLLLNDENEIVLSAVAPNYNTISKQMKAFQNLPQEVEYVQVMSANLHETLINIEGKEVVKKEIYFEMRFRLKDEYLLEKPEKPL